MTAAIRRLGAEQKDMMDPKKRSPDIFAVPLEDNIYEWHFTIRGPYNRRQQQADMELQETKVEFPCPPPAAAEAAAPSAVGSSPPAEDGRPTSSVPLTAAERAAAEVEEIAEERTSLLGYERGLYHGALLFTPNFPYEPPDIMFFTPSGRFDCNVKICSSISQYHKEHWQPTYNVSFILQSLREFMRLEDEEGIGTLHKECVSRKQKLVYAEQSWEFHCKKCGCRSSETYETYMEPYLTNASSSIPPVIPPSEPAVTNEVTKGASPVCDNNVVKDEGHSPNKEDLCPEDNMATQASLESNSGNTTDVREVLKSAHLLRLRRTGERFSPSALEGSNGETNSQKGDNSTRVQTLMKEVEKENMDHMLQQLHRPSSLTSTTSPYNHCLTADMEHERVVMPNSAETTTEGVEERVNTKRNEGMEHESDGLSSVVETTTSVATAVAAPTTNSTHEYTPPPPLILTIPVNGGVSIDILRLSDRLFAILCVIIAVIMVRRSAVWFWEILLGN